MPWGGIRLASNQAKSSGFVSRGFIDDRYSNPSFSTGYPSGGKPNYSNTEKRSASYYLNAGYAYDNRYLLDANFRSDGHPFSDYHSNLRLLGLLD